MKQTMIVVLAAVFMGLQLNPVHGKDLLDFDKVDPLNRDLLGEDYLKPRPAESKSKSEEAAPNNEYKVGVDDILDIAVIKPEAIQSTVTVAPDGTITFPYIGNVHVKGLTLPQIQEEVQKQLDNGYVEFPIVSVSLRQTRSKKFTIYGQVNQPGAYPVEDNMTILRAVTAAGGFVIPGSTGRIKILRPKTTGKGSDVIESNITAILSGKDQNVAVLPGDTLVVSMEKFFIYGQVLKPGAYAAEENMTILHAITLAGGFIESGSTGKVKLFRPKTPAAEAKFVTTDIKSVLSGASQNFSVLPGDTITVTLDKFYISGQVNRPGAYPIEENMTLLNAVTQAGGFVNASATGEIKLVRPKNGKQESQVISSDVASILNGESQDIYVQAGDSIVVSSDKFYVYGEVVRPGLYPLDVKTTTLTAISIAGGFTKFGAANRVKVLRVNKETGLYDTIKVNVNDVMNGDLKTDVVLHPHDIVVVAEGMF